MTDAAGRVLTDPEVFRAFYRESLPVVYGYFVRRCESADIAQELTQETFMTAVKALRRDPEIAAPIPWIVAIARRRLVDHYRRKRRRRDAEARVRAETAGEVAVVDGAVEPDEQLISALRRVPGEQRAALVLRYVDDLSVRDVAAALGRSEHATESLLARGRSALRAAYGEAADG